MRLQEVSVRWAKVLEMQEKESKHFKLDGKASDEKDAKRKRMEKGLYGPSARSASSLLRDGEEFSDELINAQHDSTLTLGNFGAHMKRHSMWLTAMKLILRHTMPKTP